MVVYNCYMDCAAPPGTQREEMPQSLADMLPARHLFEYCAGGGPARPKR